MLRLCVATLEEVDGTSQTIKASYVAGTSSTTRQDAVQPQLQSTLATRTSVDAFFSNFLFLRFNKQHEYLLHSSSLCVQMR